MRARQQLSRLGAPAHDAAPGLGLSWPDERRASPKRAARDVYCYFDNDIKVHAPDDARRLIAALHDA